MNHRQNNVLSTASDGTPDFAASYTVHVCPVGAVAAANSSGTTATVDAGHGFAAGDKALVWDGTTATFVAEAVNSVTATTIVWSSATPSISSGNLMVNLGPDTASGATPAYDGFSGEEFIFSDADLATQITNNKLTCSSTGDYDYYHGGDGRVWELVRDSGGTVAAVVDGYAAVPGRYNICDYGALGDDSTDNALRINAAVNAANGGVIWLPGGPNATYRCESAITLNAGDKLLGDSDAILVKNFDSANLNVGNGFIQNTNVTSASDDNIEIGGFEIKTVDTNQDGDVIEVWSDGLYIHDIYISEYSNSDVGGRGMMIRGSDVRVANCRVISSETAVSGTDGISWTGGTGCVISDCHVESGDDCFACVNWTSGDWGNAGCNDYTLSNCYAKSAGARMVYVGSGLAAMTANIDNVSISNLTGQAANGMLHVNIAHASSTGTVTNVRMSNVTCDPVSTNAANYSVTVNDTADNDLVSGVHIENCTFRVTSNASAISPAPVYFGNVNRCSLKNCDIDATGQTAAQLGVIHAEDCQDIEVCGNTIRCSSTDPTGQRWSAIQFGSGASDPTTGGHICNNNIIDVPSGLNSLATPSGGIFLAETTRVVVSGNRLSLGSGNSGSAAIRDAGGTVEGNNVIIGNEMIGFIGETAIVQLNEGDSVYLGNLGHGPWGVETGITASTTQSQGERPLTARTNVISSVGTANDVVTLPKVDAGFEVFVINNGGDTLQVFAASGDTIEGANSVTLTNGNNGHYVGASTSGWDIID